MARTEILSVENFPFECLRFSAALAPDVLRVHGHLPEAIRAPLSSAVRLSHTIERQSRGEPYLHRGCILIASRLAETLQDIPYSMRAFVLSTDNTAIYHSEKIPLNWRRATEYLNHAVTAVIDPVASIFLAVDCTAPHYLAGAGKSTTLADVIIAPSEAELIGKLSSYYGGVCWSKSVPGAVPLPDIL